MTITDARAWVGDYARNASDTTEYPAARIDRAIQFVGNRFVQKTRCTRTLSTVALTASTSTFSASTITNFRPEYLLRAYIGAKGELSQVDHADILASQVDRPQTTLPTMLGFTSLVAGEVYPTPGIAYTLSLLWTEPFVSWTPGSGSPSFNIPDEWLTQILTYGVPAALQHNEVEHLYASESWKKYLEFEAACAGIGAIGGNYHIRKVR